MEYRRLYQLYGRNRNAVAAEQRGDVSLDARFHVLKLFRSIGAIAREHSESYLRVEDRFVQRLKREQTGRLLLQLIHTGLAALTRRLENVNHGPANREFPMYSRQNQRDRNGGRMRHNMNALRHRSISRLDPGSSQPRLRLFFQRIGEIDDMRTFGCLHQPEGLSSGCR